MGHKVQPTGFRLGITEEWRSRWYADKNYAENLGNDLAIREFLNKRLEKAALSRVDIERAGDKVKVTIYTARPGIVIGKKGSEIDGLRADLEKVAKVAKGQVSVDVIEVKRPELDANLVAQSIAEQLEQRVAFRRAMRKAVQVMLGQKTRGNIVNVASIGGTNGARAGAAYTASKHALVGMTENTGYMYAHEGIRCNAICPGGVETEISGSMMSGSGISQFGMGRAMAGLDKEIRTGKPEELAAAVLFVASDEASFMTGACVKVDGGVSVN